MHSREFVLYCSFKNKAGCPTLVLGVRFRHDRPRLPSQTSNTDFETPASTKGLSNVMPAAASDEARSKERVKLSVDKATEIFAEKNIRFTDLRRRVFEEIASTQASVGAYEVLDRLAKKGTRLAPISVYRALDALLEAGVVHRLESKNAYFACSRLHQPRTGRRPMFMSCEKCGHVFEADGDDIFHAIDDAARNVKFEPRVKFVEVSGTCHDCAKRKD